MARYEISGISVNSDGAAVGRRIAETLKNDSIISDTTVKWYHRPEPGETVRDPFIPLLTSLPDWVEARFRDSNVLIIVGNISRAFILTAPYVADYAAGMAMLVIDEFGKYCVPLLPGRRNEALDFANLLERELGIIAVNMLTVHRGCDFSIERFASENNMTISNPDYAGEITARLGAGKRVGVYTNYRFRGALPNCMEFKDRGEIGIYISPSFSNAFFERTLWLIPRCVIVDLYCRSGTPAYTIQSALEKVLKKLNLYQEAVEKIRVPEEVANEMLLRTYCEEREIELGILEAPGKNMLFDEDGHEYQVISDMRTDDGLHYRVAMKNIVFSFV